MNLFFKHIVKVLINIVYISALNSNSSHNYK